MKTNRFFVCLNSVVVILAAMFYLSGVAMAADQPKEQKPADKTPPPQLDTFGDDGTPTFEDMPTPTFQPPIPTKQNGKDKEQKEKKEKKDKGDGVVTIQAALPDLKYVSTVVTPVGDVAGGSGVTGQAATLTITIINNGSGTAGEFRLDVWKHLPFPPNFGSIGDFSETFPSLAGNTSMSVSYSFTMANSYGTYFPRSTVDSGSLVAETSEANNTNTGSYTVIEMATVVPPTINTVSGASVVFRGVAKNYGKKWPVQQPSALITAPGFGTVSVPHNGTATLAGVGTFGPIVKNLIGDASLTCALASGFGGRATVTFICGTSTASGELRSVCLGAVTPAGTIITAGGSLTFTVPTNPASLAWPAGAPTASVTPAGAGTLSPVGTTTGIATSTFYSNGTFAGIANITFNYGSCSNSTTVTVVGIEFVDYAEKTLAVVTSVSADYLNKLASETGSDPIPQVDADYLQVSSFRARIRFDDPSQITERSVELQGLDDNGVVIDSISVPVTRTLGQPYLSTAIIAYNGTLTDEARQFLSNHQFWVIHNGEIIIKPPFLPNEAKVGAVGVSGIKALQGQGGQNHIIYFSAQAIDLRVEPYAKLNNTFARSFEMGPRGNFVNQNPVVMGWDFDKDFDPTVAVTALTMGGTWFNANRPYAAHQSEDANSYNRPNLVAGQARINGLTYSEQADSPTNVQLTAVQQNIRKTYMIWTGFSGNLDLHPIQLALNPAARETATFFGPFRLRMALARFIGAQPVVNDVNGAHVVDGTDSVRTSATDYANQWLKTNFTDNTTQGVKISDLVQPNVPVAFGLGAIGGLNNNQQLQQDADDQAKTAATFYHCYNNYAGGENLVGRRLQMGTITEGQSSIPTVHRDPNAQARTLFDRVNYTDLAGKNYQLVNIMGVLLFKTAFTINGEAATLDEIAATLKHEKEHLRQLDVWRQAVLAEVAAGQPADGGKYGRFVDVVVNDELILLELEAYFVQMGDSGISYRFLSRNGTLLQFQHFWQTVRNELITKAGVQGDPLEKTVPPNPPNQRRTDAITLMKNLWNTLPFEEMKKDILIEQLPNGKVVVKDYRGPEIQGSPGEFEGVFDIQILPLPAAIENEVP